MISSITKYSNSFMTVFMLVVFTSMVIIASRYPAGARFMPYVLGFPAIALCILQLFLDARDRRLAAAALVEKPIGMQTAEEQASRATGQQMHFDVGEILLPSDHGLDPKVYLQREAIVWGYFLALIVGIILFGFQLTVPIFLVLFLRFRAEQSWQKSIILSAGASIFIFGIFAYVLHLSLHPGFITDRVMDAITGG
jgi:Tripartite tricarboxylate transporter TctB family